LTDAELQRLSPIGVYGLEHSPQEMLGLAKVMMAMNFPHLARSYLSRIHLPALKAERDRLNNLCAMLGAEQIPYTLQDASHE
jgi:hypothetical protein